MEFGKLSNISQVNFDLPPDPPENREVLKNFSPKNSKPTIYIGATGYNMKQWVGKWYPPATRDREHLLHYGRQFNTIEHNTTHYRIPDSATVQRWREEVPADFRYCPKLPQIISHAANLGVSGTQIREFTDSIFGLEEKLGCCFMQLPPQFSVFQWRVLDAFFQKISADLPLAIEVRNESFFDGSAAAEAFFQMLSDVGKTAVITDVAGRRDVCHLRLTTAQTMIRFVGNDLHSSDFQRIEQWAQQLSKWFSEGLQAAYFFTHEPDNLLAPDLAKFAGEVFSRKMPQVSIRFPAPVQVPVQGSLF